MSGLAKALDPTYVLEEHNGNGDQIKQASNWQHLAQAPLMCTD